jgi:hypothetical protein
VLKFALFVQPTGVSARTFGARLVDGPISVKVLSTASLWLESTEKLDTRLLRVQLLALASISMTLLFEAARTICCRGGRAAATGKFTGLQSLSLGNEAPSCGVMGVIWTGARSMTYAPFKRVCVAIVVCSQAHSRHMSCGTKQ